MSSRRKNAWPFANSSWFAVMVICVTLLILGGTIVMGRQYLRQRTREQMAGRDAHILNTLWQTQFNEMTEEGLEVLARNPGAQFLTMLDTSRLQGLKGFRAARLFDESGEFVITEPADIANAELRPDDLKQLRELKPVTHFYEALESEVLGLSAVDPVDGQDRRAPILEVVLPIHSGAGSLLGAVQFVLDGSALTAEFQALDRSLWLHAALAFLVSGGVVVLVLGLAFHRLQLANRLLSERTESLLRANQELALAAKTSAVGAVTSHLIHGLKNPLSGLQSFISSRGGGPLSESDRDWQVAISTARRMQNLVSEVVRVLREENSGGLYELTLQELLGIIASKTRPVAEQSGVVFQTLLTADGILANRNANLVMLILDNLIQNAIQATPRGKTVALDIRSMEGKISCEIRDQGPGIPEAYRDQLFKPCQSTKDKGSGIGLAISKQLANYLGAELDLKNSSDSGCVFVLLLPPKVFVGALNSEATSN